MNRKRLYAGLAGLFLFDLVFLLAKQFLFQEEPISSCSGREIYETLMSLKPGTSVEKVQEILGKPDDVASNVLNWFHVDGQGKVGAAFSVVTSQGRATVPSYLEYAKDKKAASKRYKAVQRELSSVFGSPAQEVPGLACVWFPRKILFSLVLAEDSQPPAVAFVLKEPLIEGR